MTSFSSKNFKIGPCGVIFRGEILGISRNASQITFKKKCHTASLTMEIMLLDKTFGLFWDENKPITLNMLRQKQKSIKGGELQLIPISPLDMTAYRFPHAIPHLVNATCSFSVYEEHSMTIEFEANYVDSEEILFERISIDEMQRAKILPPAIDPESLERAMTAYIADKLDMSVNIDVFRGKPRIDANGLSVMLKEEQAQSALINRRYEFNVACFNTERDKAMHTIHKLDCQLPIYRESISLDKENTVIMKAVLSGNCNFDSKIVDKGETQTIANLALTVII